MESLSELNIEINKINSPKQNDFNLFKVLDFIIKEFDDSTMVERVSKFSEAILQEAENETNKQFFESMTLSDFKEYCHSSYSRANKSSEDFQKLVSLIEAMITPSQSPVFNVDNASPLEYLLAAYVQFFLVESEEIRDKSNTQLFIQGIVNGLKMITSKNAAQENNVFRCEQIRMDIALHARNLFLKASIPTLAYNQSHDILTVLEIKAALAYLIYICPQEFICNYSEFAVPISRLLSDLPQPAKDEVPITHEGMGKLLNSINASWKNVISLVTSTLNKSDANELLKKGNLKESIINHLQCTLITKKLLSGLEKAKPRFR